MTAPQVPQGWHVCAPCESVAPPRSRHCGVCGVCVLKREHHCIFTGCCIGLTNHRHFFSFLVYMWLSTLYCSVVNAFFISPYISELLLSIPGHFPIFSLINQFISNQAKIVSRGHLSELSCRDCG